MRFFLAILASVLAAATIVQAAVSVLPALHSSTVLSLAHRQPVNINQSLGKPSDAIGKVVNYVSNTVSHTFQSSIDEHLRKQTNRCLKIILRDLSIQVGTA